MPHGELTGNRRNASDEQAKMTIRWLVPIGKVRSMTDALHRLMPVAREAPDLIGGTVTADIMHIGVIRYVYEWQSVDALRRQFGADRFNELLLMTEDASESPVIEFELPDGHRGREYVTEWLPDRR